MIYAWYINPTRSNMLSSHSLDESIIFLINFQVRVLDPQNTPIRWVPVPESLKVAPAAPGARLSFAQKLAKILQKKFKK